MNPIKQKTIRRSLLVLGSFASMLFSSTLLVSAEETSSRSATVKPIVKELRTDIKNDIRTMQTDVKAVRDNASTSGKTNAEVRGEIKNIREETRSDIKDSVEKARSALRKEKENRIKREVQKVIERFNAAIERLEKLALRIDSRIKKFEARGADVAVAKSKLAEAKVKISEAQGAVLSLGSGSTTPIIASTTPSGIIISKEFREAVEKTKNIIKAAHAALVDAIVALKPAAEKAETETATSTNND